jgi:glycosyltransferase involved in cell wall biosynthesis
MSPLNQPHGRIKGYPRISVVICTLNEEGNLPRVLPKIPNWVNEIILVDGHSTDNTVKVAQTLRPDAKIFLQDGKGKGNALKLGFQRATGDIIVTLDADGATEPEEIHRFVSALMQGYDFAKGTRLKFGRPKYMRWHRWLGNKILVLAANILFRTNYTDICSGYNAFWKKKVRGIKFYTSGFEMEQEFYVKLKKMRLRVIEVPFTEGKRESGSSKVSDFKQGLKDLLTILAERLRS